MSITGEVRDLKGDIRHWRRGRIDTTIFEASVTPTSLSSPR